MHCKRLLERAVEDGIAGGVDEVGDQDAVFFRDFGCVVGAEVEDGRDDQNEDERGDGGET